MLKLFRYYDNVQIQGILLFIGSLEANFPLNTDSSFRINSNGSPFFPFHIVFFKSLSIDQIQTCIEWKIMSLLKPIFVMWPCKKNIFHIQVQLFYFFGNPTHKTRTRTANMWELLIIANHLNESSWLANQKTRITKSNRIYCTLLSSSRCTAVFRLLPASANWANLQQKKTNFLS